MGIDGLWKELELIEQKISLHNLAVGTGFIGNATGARGFRVGIDASGWMYRACNRHGITESPELVALFSRCSRLFRLPFIPIFVFDGPERPRFKRSKVIRGNDHWLTSSFQLMLDGFGFEWIMARGEAEATLSEMTTSRVPASVDAILTDDSDSFVFGANVVLRIRSEDNENYEASRYSAFDISQVLGLSRDDFILIAILAGGDYSEGLPNCGIRTALGLARAGLGKLLISGLSGLSHKESGVFLETWRTALRSELQTNTSGHLPHLYPQLAANIPADFPDLAVINLYRSPVISELEVGRSLYFRPPRLDILARFAEDHFGWGDSVGILTHFADQLFAGLVVRELAHRASAADDLIIPTRSPSLIKSIVGERRHKTTGHLAELRLMLNLDPNILKSALQAITGRRDPELGAQAAVATWLTDFLPKVRVWVPQSMVEHVYRRIVLDYVSGQKPKPVRKKKNRHHNINDHAATSNLATANPQDRAMYRGHNEQQDSLLGKVTGPPAYPEKRYTAMSVTYQGQEVLELITDSEGEY
ncbi:PIN domain-like protein [Mycena albidolilacea]|uniref:PIN domain-like protein n=1 Tax=Mycena albidolilacea TaxID=1033008 RepID=A0AAD6ZD87_9AGAR|nr:PIN domain-like protein [Mycena albidolilacea]